MSENLLKGHYGVNLSEFSAPASSILWPVILSPLTALPFTEYSLLALNTLFSFLSLWFADKIFLAINNESPKPYSNKGHRYFLLLFILLSNVVGLLFTGMEHNLQTLLAIIIFYGLLLHVQNDEAPAWLWLSIIAAPLVRYECLALSAAALLYLFANKYYFKSLISGFLIVILLASFSGFLLSIGLSYLPDSILAKSSLAASGIDKLAMNVMRNLSLVTPKGIVLVLLAGFFFHCAWFKSVAYKKRCLALCIGLAVLGHLLVGRIGWYFRYEIYLWCISLFLLFYIRHIPFLPKVSIGERRFTSFLIGLCIFIGSVEHLIALGTTAMASSNIYHQQAQMQRFVNDFYQRPVAINDLGLVSYKNDLYVLDLWGLASSEARILRQSEESSIWMNELTDKHSVDLAMIYHDKIWFETVPDNWIKLGQMQITGTAITARFPVSFFATSKVAIPAIKMQLQKFIPSLPSGSQFVWQDQKANANNEK